MLIKFSRIVGIINSKASGLILRNEVPMLTRSRVGLKDAGCAIFIIFLTTDLATRLRPVLMQSMASNLPSPVLGASHNGPY